jgi:uncharacterized small protein (DUF1192 family)
MYLFIIGMSAKGFEAQQQIVAAHTLRIANLEEELTRLKRGKKRKGLCRKRGGG